MKRSGWPSWGAEALRVLGAALRAIAAALLAALALGAPAAAQSAAPPEATPLAPGAPLSLVVLTSKEPGSDRQTADAIRAYTSWQAEEINRAGGVRGHPLRMVYYDDANDIAQTEANVEQALAAENLLGIIGLWSSTRGAAVTERIGASGVPFISEISRQELIAPHPNIFSMARAAAADLPAFIDFVTRPKRHVAYFGVEGDLFTLQFKETLERLAAEERVEVASWEWIEPGQETTPEWMDAAIARIRSERPDLLVFAIGSSHGGAMLKRLHDAGIALPVYAASGSMVRMLNAVGAEEDYRGEMFQTRSSIPGVTNSRLAALSQQSDYVRVGAAFPPGDRSYGASYADIVAVLAQAADGPADAGLTLAALRRDAIAALAQTSDGARIFRGATRDWAFDAGGSAIEPVYLLRRPAGSRELQLFERQVAPAPASASGAGAGAGAPRAVPIALVSFDLAQINNIDSSGETFEASFYLSIESEDGLDIDDLDFANVAQSDVGAASMLSVRLLREEPAAAGEGRRLRIYKIEGRFQFDPDLTRYPFDSQVFSIQLQPADTTTPFILQPPPERLRDRSFQIPGWSPLAGPGGEYVGADNDLISVVEEGGARARIIAFQRYSFTWVAERQSIDYYLRVVLPLALIMLVAYLSVFIPKDRFDSAVSLQVTALLSTIALYLAIPKISPDTATLSDQTFVFAEAVIVLIIALSILRVNVAPLAGGWLSRVLSAVQILSFPLLAFLMLRYVDAVRSGASETIAGKSLPEVATILGKLLVP